MFYQNQLSQMEFFFQYTIGVTPYLWYFWDGEIALLFVGIDHETMAFCELDENTSCNQPVFRVHPLFEKIASFPKTVISEVSSMSEQSHILHKGPQFAPTATGRYDRDFPMSWP